MSETYGSAKMTKAEFDDLTPSMKGYACYMFGAWPDAGEWLKSCPFNEDDNPTDYSEFKRGEFAAMLEAQDLDS